MSELSDKIRSEFKKSDDERDALMNTPEDVDRWDNIVYGHDDREIQKLDVYRPKQAQGEATSGHHQRTWRRLDVRRQGEIPVLLHEPCTARLRSNKLYIPPRPGEQVPGNVRRPEFGVQMGDEACRTLPL